MAKEQSAKIYLQIVLVVMLVAITGVTIWLAIAKRDAHLRGGTELLCRIREGGVHEDEKDAITRRTVDVIRRRIDPTGELGADIRPRGKCRFAIRLPRMRPEEVRRIESVILRAGKLEFYFVNSRQEDRGATLEGDAAVRNTHTAFFPVRDPKGAPGAGGRPQIKHWVPVDWDELDAKLAAASEAEHWLLVEQDPQKITGADLEEVRPAQDYTGRPAIGFAFRGRARSEFADLTEANVGRQLAIVLDNVLYSAPVIQTRISGRGEITGNFTRQETDDIISVLQSGQLLADIELEQKRTLGVQGAEAGVSR